MTINPSTTESIGTQDSSTSFLKRDTQSLGKDRILETISMRFKDTIIEVRSTILKDSISVDEPNMFAPIPLQQSVLIFTSENKPVKELQHPVKRVTLRTSNGNQVNLLDNMIVSLRILEGTKKAVIFVEGYGGCNACSEFYEVIDLNGNIWGINYRTTAEVFRDDLDYNAVADKIGADASIFWSKDNRGFDVYDSLWGSYMLSH